MLHVGRALEDRPLVQVQVDLRFQEQGAADEYTLRHHDSAAAFAGQVIDAAWMALVLTAPPFATAPKFDRRRRRVRWGRDVTGSNLSGVRCFGFVAGLGVYR